MRPDPPHPLLSACGSVILPGWGQILNGDRWRGVFFLGGLWIVAAAWIPDASVCSETGEVRPEFVWAALDCPSAFPLLEDPAAQKLEPLVLGRLVAHLEHPAKVGQRLVLSAWSIELGDRSGLAGTALYDESGACLARARATWISLARAS